MEATEAEKAVRRFLAKNNPEKRVIEIGTFGKNSILLHGVTPYEDVGAVIGFDDIYVTLTPYGEVKESIEWRIRELEFCDYCPAKDCDDCRCKEFRNNPRWWLSLTDTQEPSEETKTNAFFKFCGEYR